MQLLFSDGTSVAIELLDTPLKTVCQHWFKNLSRVPLPECPWFNPYASQTHSYESVVDSLCKFGQMLDIVVDRSRALSKDQTYFNELHEMYERDYVINPDPNWMNFHDHIHWCEQFYETNGRRLVVYHRELSGPLAVPMNLDWMNAATHLVQAGDVYVSWAELGKIPYVYWKTGEPNQLSRMKELMQPWKNLYTKLTVAVESFDTIQDLKVDEFNHWWQHYEQPWCEHHGITHWNIQDQFGVLVIGRIQNIDLVQDLCKKNILPAHIRL